MKYCLDVTNFINIYTNICICIYTYMYKIKHIKDCKELEEKYVMLKK